MTLSDHCEGDDKGSIDLSPNRRGSQSAKDKSTPFSLGISRVKYEYTSIRTTLVKSVTLCLLVLCSLSHLFKSSGMNFAQRDVRVD